MTASEDLDSLLELLTANRDLLVRHISVYNFFPRLRSKHVLTQEDEQTISNSYQHANDTQKAGCLLDTVSRKGIVGINVFLEIVEYELPEIFTKITGKQPRDRPDDYIEPVYQCRNSIFIAELGHLLRNLLHSHSHRDKQNDGQSSSELKEQLEKMKLIMEKLKNESEIQEKENVKLVEAMQVLRGDMAKLKIDNTKLLQERMNNLQKIADTTQQSLSYKNEREETEKQLRDLRMELNKESDKRRNLELEVQELLGQLNSHRRQTVSLQDRIKSTPSVQEMETKRLENKKLTLVVEKLKRELDTVKSVGQASEASNHIKDELKILEADKRELEEQNGELGQELLQKYEEIQNLEFDVERSRRAAESYEMRVHLLEKELKQQKEICISYHTEVLTLKKERDGITEQRNAAQQQCQDMMKKRDQIMEEKYQLVYGLEEQRHEMVKLMRQNYSLRNQSLHSFQSGSSQRDSLDSSQSGSMGHGSGSFQPDNLYSQVNKTLNGATSRQPSPDTFPKQTVDRQDSNTSSSSVGHRGRTKVLTSDTVPQHYRHKIQKINETCRLDRDNLFPENELPMAPEKMKYRTLPTNLPSRQLPLFPRPRVTSTSMKAQVGSQRSGPRELQTESENNPIDQDVIMRCLEPSHGQPRAVNCHDDESPYSSIRDSYFDTDYDNPAAVQRDSDAISESDSDTEDHDSCLQNADFSDQTLQLADLDPLKPGSGDENFTFSLTAEDFMDQVHFQGGTYTGLFIVSVKGTAKEHLTPGDEIISMEHSGMNEVKMEGLNLYDAKLIAQKTTRIVNLTVRKSKKGLPGFHQLQNLLQEQKNGDAFFVRTSISLPNVSALPGDYLLIVDSWCQDGEQWKAFKVDKKSGKKITKAGMVPNVAKARSLTGNSPPTSPPTPSGAFPTPFGSPPLRPAKPDFGSKPVVPIKPKNGIHRSNAVRKQSISSADGMAIIKVHWAAGGAYTKVKPVKYHLKRPVVIFGPAAVVTKVVKALVQSDNSLFVASELEKDGVDQNKIADLIMKSQAIHFQKEDGQFYYLAVSGIKEAMKQGKHSLLNIPEVISIKRLHTADIHPIVVLLKCEDKLPRYCATNGPNVKEDIEKIEKELAPWHHATVQLDDPKLISLPSLLTQIKAQVQDEQDSLVWVPEDMPGRNCEQLDSP